uniref:THAP domain-containing protein 1 n=1 Tax=Oreochromis niloticus TaxID=8128 RepID=A0A669DH03_ORENI
MSNKQKRKDRFKLQRMLSFHSFPKDSELDGFTVTTRSRVCSRHFETGEIFVSSSGKRRLQPKAVPSLFHWNNFSQKTERPGVWERRPRPVDTVAMATVDYNTEDENDVSDMPITGCTESAPASIPLTEEHDYAASPLIVVDHIKYETMSREIEELRRQLEARYFQLTSCAPLSKRLLACPPMEH